MRKILAFLALLVLLVALAQTPARYAVVENGEVVNIIVWDGVKSYNPDDPTTIPKEYLVVLPTGSPVDIGWSYDKTAKTFSPPVGECISATLDAPPGIDAKGQICP